MRKLRNNIVASGVADSGKAFPGGGEHVARQVFLGITEYR
jgi:hypothetical protein